MSAELPNSLRYVKNGVGGRWWKAARESNQLHAGWNNTPDELILAAHFLKLEKQIKKEFGVKRGAKQDFNALRTLLDSPSKHLWTTFEDGFLWWCTVFDGPEINPEGESQQKGHFWLRCDRPWSNRSLDGRRLFAMAELPGPVTTTAGFKATVCQPKAWETVLRIIRGEKDPQSEEAEVALKQYQAAIYPMISVSPRKTSSSLSTLS